MSRSVAGTLPANPLLNFPFPSAPSGCLPAYYHHLVTYYLLAFLSACQLNDFVVTCVTLLSLKLLGRFILHIIIFLLLASSSSQYIARCNSIIHICIHPDMQANFQSARTHSWTWWLVADGLLTFGCWTENR